MLEVCRDQGLNLIEEAGIDDVILSLLGSTLDGMVNCCRFNGQNGFSTFKF
jgi:hypothetical protein